MAVEKKVKLTKEERKALRAKRKAELKAQGKGFREEFKKFIAKGNVIDLAVAVVVGGAFGKIVTSFVSDIINPLIGLITGNVKLNELKLPLRAADEAAGLTELNLNYGNLLQNILDFLIIAVFVFIAIKIVRSVRENVEEGFVKIVEFAKDKLDGEKDENAESEKEQSTPVAEPSAPVAEPSTPVVEAVTKVAENASQEKQSSERIEELLREIRDCLKQNNGGEEASREE